jgi:hypothetical protein
MTCVQATSIQITSNIAHPLAWCVPRDLRTSTGDSQQLPPITPFKCNCCHVQLVETSPHQDMQSACRLACTSQSTTLFMRNHCSMYSTCSCLRRHQAPTTHHRTFPSANAATCSIDNYPHPALTNMSTHPSAGLNQNKWSACSAHEAVAEGFT